MSTGPEGNTCPAEMKITTWAFKDCHNDFHHTDKTFNVMKAVMDNTLYDQTESLTVQISPAFQKN